MKSNEIKLNEDQRKELLMFSKTGVHSAKLITRAGIILLLDTSVTGKAISFDEISKRLGISVTTVTKVKKDFLKSKDVKTFLQRKKRDTPPVAPKITGEVEARIIALACGTVPEGYAKWSLQLLADKSIELNYIDSVSDMSIHRLLKKHNLSLT
jgi:transposase